jgi:ribosome-binding factor A
MRPFSRSDRVSGLIKQALSEILQKRINDPRLGLVTISVVKLSRDLKNARIYYTAPAGEKNKEAAAAGFKDAAGFIKRALGRKVHLRYMPELKFFPDESFDYGSSIDKLLASIKTKNEPDTSSLE